MKSANRVTGIAALVLSLIYISAFVYYGAFWRFPIDGDAQTKMTFIAEHQTITAVFLFITYILFGLVLSILVAGTSRLLGNASEQLKSVTNAFGYLWVGLVIASGMIAIGGVSYAIGIAQTDAQKALDAWTLLMTIAQSIGGDNEIVGAVWVILVSVLALKADVLSKKLNYLGIAVGLAGVATITSVVIFKELFGVLQIIWFFWLGLCFMRLPSNEAKV
ncbi:hypothetical protein [Rheinheimera sp. WS51]|uniref:hypothetical protein n=1 Tax=Rheinheimera sp. WS51 TaxID=3425886 RepID=UPI003D911BA2